MEGRREGRREEPPGADDGTHVPGMIVLIGGQAHGPSIAHGAVLLRYQGPAGRRTAGGVARSQVRIFDPRCIFYFYSLMDQKGSMENPAEPESSKSHLCLFQYFGPMCLRTQSGELPFKVHKP